MRLRDPNAGTAGGGDSSRSRLSPGPGSVAASVVACGRERRARRCSRACRWGAAPSSACAIGGSGSAEAAMAFIPTRGPAARGLPPPPRDLGHLLLHLNRGVVADPDRKQPQRSVAQLGRFVCTRRDERSSISAVTSPPIGPHSPVGRDPVRVITSRHAPMIPAGSGCPLGTVSRRGSTNKSPYDTDHSAGNTVVQRRGFVRSSGRLSGSRGPKVPVGLAMAPLFDRPPVALPSWEDHDVSTTNPCPFCERAAAGGAEFHNAHAVAVPDGFPVSPGTRWLSRAATAQGYVRLERRRVRGGWRLARVVRESLHERLHPDGFNVGANDGAGAGQTVPHAHVHVIPRFDGDVPDPRGGIRWVIPGRAAYWEAA